MNKSMSCLRFCFLVLFLSLSAGGGPAGFLAGSLLHAAAPLKINYQGQLEESGAPVDGARSFVFKMYDAASNGSLIWTSAAQNVSVANGVFSVILQTGTPVDLSTAAFAGARYVEISVGGVTLAPRQEMLSAPYALVAQSLSSDARVNPSSLEAGILGADIMVSSIAINAVYTNALIDGAVTFLKMADNSCAANQIMKRNAGNTAWVCAPDAGAGSGVSLAPPSPDSDTLANDSIYINDTGGGNLLRLQQGGVDKFVVDGTGLLLTGSIGAAGVAGGSLLNTVIASSLAVNSVYDGAIVSMASSKLTGALPAISGEALTNVNSAQFTAVAVDTTTLKTQVDAKATDTLVTHLAGVETITGVKTFSADPVFTNDNAIPQAKVNGLTAALAATVDGAACPTGMAYIPGPYPYCIDKYEAYLVSGSVSNDACTNGSQAEVDANATTAVAGSAASQTPLVNINWCAAKKACQNAGKHLLTNSEWFNAANYKGSKWSINGETIGCNTSGSAATLTGANAGCVTQEGVYDMIGNVLEWVDFVMTADPTNGLTANNYVTGYDFATGIPTSVGTASPAFGNDYYWAYNSGGSARAVIRGGTWGNDADAGVFAFGADYAPSLVSPYIGFRCGRRK